MRLLAALLTLALLGASALAAHGLWQKLSLVPAEVVVPGPGEIAEAEPPVDIPPASRRWPALFGEPQPPAPPEPPVPEPQPPAPAPEPPKTPKPPLESLGYTLSGVVRTDQNTWAVVNHPTGSRLLKVGDPLEDGIIVERIDDLGLWVSRDGDEPELLAFPE